MAARLMRVRNTVLQSTTTTAVFKPLTDWMPTIIIVRLRVLLALVSKSTNFQVQLAIQTADTDPAAANAAVPIGNAVSSVGRTLQDVDVTLSGNGQVNAHMWFRLGVLGSNVTGAAQESGTVAMQASFRDAP